MGFSRLKTLMGIFCFHSFGFLDICRISVVELAELYFEQLFF